MHRDEAERKARIQWGASADVFEARHKFVWDGRSEITNGRGETWEEAFDNATLREHLGA